MQSTGLWSLNHDLTTSLGLSHTPNFPKIHPHFQRCISIRVHPYAHPQHIKVLKHFVYIWYGCGMQSTGLWSLNHDLTTSLGLTYVPNLPKINPHLHRRNSVRVHPCAHPLYIKALNTLYIHVLDVGCNLRGFGGPTIRQNNKKTRQKRILASKTPTSRGILALGWTHMPIHSISRC